MKEGRKGERMNENESSREKERDGNGERSVVDHHCTEGQCL